MGHMSNFLKGFIRTEAFSGVLVIIAATTAVLWANLSGSYLALWHTDIALGFGDHFAALDLEHLIGEVAMSAFFLLVGLEVRREMVGGHLQTRSSRVAPLIAAVAGTILPAALYLMLAEPADSRGWPIPTATDIALVVGVFALLARRLHPAARILLLSIAVIDDVIGIALLALLSTGTLKPIPLVAAFVVTAVAAWVGRRRHLPIIVLVIVWLVLLVLLFSAGLHPTLSGVLVALAASPREPGEGHESDPTPVERLEMALHPWVSYLVLPIFVLSHAGVDLSAADSTTVAVAVALLAGKPVAVTLSLLVGARLRLFTLSEGLTGRDISVLGLLCGGGLTVSSLLASAALDQPGPAILGVLIGSFISIVAAVLLAHVPRRTNSSTANGTSYQL